MWLSLISQMSELLQYPPGNMWPSIVIMAICGRALSSWQQVAEHCHHGNMWPRVVILATCGRALSCNKIMTKLEVMQKGKRSSSFFDGAYNLLNEILKM